MLLDSNNKYTELSITDAQASIDKKFPKRKELVKQELEKLENANGYLTREMVVEAARADNHPLHQFFEWDDTIASERYRLDQAYVLIRKARFLQVLKQANKAKHAVVTVRQFLPVREGDKKFVTRLVVFNEVDLKKAFISRKVAALVAWCDSVADVPEFVKMCRIIRRELETFL